MARETKTLVTIIDDLDGTPIDDGSAETIRFSLENTAYEIDLSKDNAKSLRDALKPYIKAGRPVTARRGSSGGGVKTDKAELQAMREWAKANGYEVSDRGRVSQTIQEAYRASK